MKRLRARPGRRPSARRRPRPAAPSGLGRGFAALYDHAPIAVALLGPDGRFLRANAGYSAMLGYSEAELAKLRFADVTHPEDSPTCVENYERVQRGAIDHFTMEKRFLRKDGRVIWANVVVAAVRDDGRLLHTISVASDVTDRREWAARLEREVQAKTEELERSNADLLVYATAASHDLKAPLRKIITFGDFLAQRASGKLDEKELDFLARIRRSAATMVKLVEDVLTLSRAGRETLPLEDVDLNASFSEALSDLNGSVHETGAEVAAGALPVVRAHASAMRRLMQNLFANALKFRRPGVAPRIEVSSKPGPDGGVEISFRDNGIGFDPKYAHEVFEPFRRLNPVSDYEGSGIGLAVCDRVARRYGGSMRAESVPGEGSTFTLSLPAAAVVRPA